jgi:serine/threonine protein kinase
MGVLVGHDRFRVGKQLSRRNSCVVHRGKDIKTGAKVVINLEPECTRKPSLMHEARVLQVLEKMDGVPKIIHLGVESNFNVMVVDMLGPSLEDLYRHCKGFDTRTIGNLALQMLNRLELLHAKDLVHRNIRPESFVIGNGTKISQLHMVGLGNAKNYKHSKSKEHVQLKERKDTTSNPVFASLQTHLGVEHSRRDDLESLGYVLVYFFKGSLPWQVAAQDGHEDAVQIKRSVSMEDLCQGCPRELEMYVRYCRSLEFKERPNYTLIHALFCKLGKDGPDSRMPLCPFIYNFSGQDWVVRQVSDKEVYETADHHQDANPLFFQSEASDLECEAGSGVGRSAVSTRCREFLPWGFDYAHTSSTITLPSTSEMDSLGTSSPSTAKSLRSHSPAFFLQEAARLQADES